MENLPNLKPGQPVSKNWKRINDLISGLGQLESRIRALDLAVASLRAARGRYGNEYHPFKIYSAAADVENFWRKFYIRSGCFNNFPVAGTDGVAFPHSPMLPDDSVIPVEVNPGIEKYYFWIEISDGKGTVNHGQDPGISWAAFPRPTEERLLIGWVDTKTDLESQVARVRQFLLGDVQVPLADARWC